MLTPILRPHLDILFIGFNPHPFSWERGKYYAHGSLWRIVRKAGLGEIYDDSQLLDYNYGITDLVHDKPTREAHEIADEEYLLAAARLRRQLKRLRPRVVCFTGKGVYKFFVGLKSTKGIEYGAAGEFEGSALYVVPFPSHKWMTDAAKVEHYQGLRALLPPDHRSVTEKVLSQYCRIVRRSGRVELVKRIHGVRVASAYVLRTFILRRLTHMQDDKLAADEARRIAQLGNIKSQVETDVNSEIAARADRTTRPEAARMEQVAGEFRGKAIDEVVDTEREVQRSRGLARVSQVVDYIFFLIYALLGVRLVLALLAARNSAGFVQFIKNITDPLYAPFKGIVASPSTAEGYTLALPIVIALIVYALVHAAINRLLRLFAHRKTEI